MKKILSVILLVSALLLVVGCNSKSNKDYKNILDYTTKSDQVGQSAFYINYEIPKNGTLKKKVKITQSDVKLIFTNNSGTADIYLYNNKGKKVYKNENAQSGEFTLKDIGPTEITVEIKGSEHKGELKLVW